MSLSHLANEWSNERALRLIEEYEGKRELWDNQDDNYRVQSAKYAAWAELAEMFHCHPMDVKRKMNSLLTSHRRERYRVGRGRRSRWFAYDALHFIADKFPIKETFEDDPDFEPSDDLADEDQADNSADNRSTPVKIKKEKDTFKRRPVKRKRSTACKPHRRVASIKENRRRDACDVFGEYVAQALRQHDNKTKSIIKHAINNILFDTEMKKYNLDFEQLAEEEEEDLETQEGEEEAEDLETQEGEEDDEYGLTVAQLMDVPRHKTAKLLNII